MLLLGLAMMVGGVAVLVWLRNELGARVPVLDAIADLVRRAVPALRWLRHAVGAAPWPRPARPPGVAGRASVPADTVLQGRLPPAGAGRAVGRASPPPASVIRRP